MRVFSLNYFGDNPLFDDGYARVFFLHMNMQNCMARQAGEVLKKEKKGESVVRWDLEGPISSGYLAHCSHSLFHSIHIEFSLSYFMLSQSLVIPTLLARLFINPELCQCPLRRSCQLQLF